MWKLKQPTAIDLQNYENMMLQDLYDRVNNCVIEVIKNNLLPILPDGTKDKRILKMLLTSNVYESYQESERLMGLIFNGYTRTELNLYFKAEHTKQVSRTEAQNNLITKYQSTMKELVTVIGYKDAFANVKNAYQVTDWKGANACTYCNRSYIFTISTGLKNKDKVARPELDHWYAKSKYPLLSMNYYNLIPSCSVCNSSVKGSTSFDVRTHVHPYLQKAYNPSFNFCYNPAAPKWEQITIDDRQSSEREKNTVDAFKLRIVYNCHADLEAKELYDLAVSNGPRYIKDLLKLLSINYYGKNEQDVYRMIFGTELAPQRFGERPMSKFKHDLLKQMKVLKNGHYM